MKRPDGVRPPRAPQPDPAPAPDVQEGGSGEPTEPIRIVPALGLPRVAKPGRAAGRESAAESAPTASAERLDRVRGLVSGLRLPGGERRSVARAARQRRRFERGEVRRFTRRARRRRTIALVTAGSLVLLAVVVAIAAYSPLMAVRTIEITGTERVDAQSLEGALADQIGVPLTLVDRGAVGRVLGDYPLIQSYSVQTRPPSTLVVSVVERTPVGVIADGARFDLVDSAGVVIESADQAQAGYPTITTPTPGGSGAAFRAAARVLLTLPPALEEQVSSVSATTGDDVSLALQNGSTVVWGGSDESALKAVVLEKLMAATDPATVASYDVSSPEAAVVAQR